MQRVVRARVSGASEGYHLPNLHDVIFRDRADHPGFAWIPREVRYLRRVTAVNELKGRR